MTKTIPCRIAVKQPIATTDAGSFALVRGMFVRCRLEFHVSSGDGESPYLSIPEQAVQPNDHVWTVKDKRLKRKPIKVVDYVRTVPTTGSNSSAASPRLAIIARTEDGPETGDQVVVSPLSQPSDDTEVEVPDSNAGASNGSSARTNKDTSNVSIKTVADSGASEPDNSPEGVR